jgi:ascorbate-specific PTS system EIIC-type component UlaA
LKCANCGKEILDEKSSFCAYCGVSFSSKPQNTALTTVAGTLTTIAAAFSAAVGTIGIVYYQTYTDYYASYGYDTSNYIGFLLFGIFAFIASAFGFAGGILTLTKERFKISIIGRLLMIASAIFTFIIVWHYQYGFTEGILLSGISIGAFSIVSTAFTITSKTEFTEDTEITEDTETEP